MLLYSVPQQHCRRGCGGSAKTIGRKNAGSHGGEAMAATWIVLYFARETEHIEGRKPACASKSTSHTGMCPHFGLQAFMKAMDILAGDHRQRFLVSAHSVLTCII